MASENLGDQYMATVGTSYLLRFEEDTLRERRLPMRVIIELVGTFMLVTVAAGARRVTRTGRRYAPGGRDRSGRTRRGNI